MTSCEACGSPLPPDAEFCPVCAAPVPQRPESAATAVPTAASPAAEVPGQRAASPPAAVADATHPPAPAAAGEAEWASPWRRLGAFAIDQAVVSLPALVIAMVQLARLESGQAVEELVRVQLLSLLSLVGWAVLWVVEARTGRTVGNAAVGIRTVDEETLQPAGLRAIFVRLLVQGVGSLACLVGMYVVVVSGLWDSGTRRQGWQDKAAGTVVLRTRRGAAPAPAGSVPSAAAPSASPAPPPPPVGHGRTEPAPTPSPTPADLAAAPTLAGPSPVPVEPSAPAAPIIAAVPGFPARTAPAEPAGSLAPTAPAGRPEPAPEEPAPAPPSPAPPSPVVPSPAEPVDDVDQTRLAGPAERGDVVLVLPGGERLTVDGEGVLGRNPATPVGHEVAHLVPVADPTRSVSKTHLGFGLDTVGLWVKDLHSTNGTAVIGPDGTRSPLTPGLAVHVMPGDVVVVGDVRVEVTR